MLENSLIDIFNSAQISLDEPSPSEWIENNRFIQPHVSERMFGKFDWSNTPYMKEIVNHLDPYSPVSHVVLMKGVRIGGTFALVHNGVPYIISQRPTNIMLISANDTLAEKSMQGVEFGIDGCNINHLIGKPTKAKNNSKGDTMNSKFFSGGYELFNFGGQAASNMRQVTAGIILADEVDAIKGTDKESGSFLKLMEDRARSYGESKKIIYMSSPLLLVNSLIYKLYLQGDQRVFYVPCPKCGEYIELVWNEKNENNVRYGVIFDVKNGEVIQNSVRYRCGKCENEFEEKKYKREMLNNGYWKPSIEREDKTFVSYRISALYAPVTMDNWYDFAKEYQMAFPRNGIKDNALFQSFTNSIEGKPYKPEGVTLKSSKLQENRRPYKIGECPFDLAKSDGNGEIMILSFTCDLNGYEHDARLDYEILAHSEKGATYSIDAGSLGTFIPKVEKDALEREGLHVGKMDSERIKYTYQMGVENSVWDLVEEKLRIRYGKSERKLTIVVIDVGAFKDYAMAFVKKMNMQGFLILPVMGADEEIFTAQIKTETGNIYGASKTGDIYLLNVNVIKDRLAKYINSESYIDDHGQLNQSPYFMNFPEQEPTSRKYTYRNYFAHYEAEHRIEKKSEGAQTRYLWEKKRPGIQNHFWDVRVYGVFCAIFMADLICSNDNPYKRLYYKSQKIKASWENMCKLIKEASIENNVPLS
jgi:phage terminase large subunit GpA-like protein